MHTLCELDGGGEASKRIKEGSWGLGLSDLEGGGDICSDREHEEKNYFGGEVGKLRLFSF